MGSHTQNCDISIGEINTKSLMVDNKHTHPSMALTLMMQQFCRNLWLIQDAGDARLACPKSFRCSSFNPDCIEDLAYSRVTHLTIMYNIVLNRAIANVLVGLVLFRYGHADCEFWIEVLTGKLGVCSQFKILSFWKDRQEYKARGRNK